MAPRPPADQRERPLAEGIPLSKIVRRQIRLGPDVVMASDPKTAAAEQFRRLRTRLVHQSDDPKVIVVTSSIPGEGKSTVAINLAMAFAGASMEKTLLIDADMRRPRIQTLLRPEPTLGLAEVLRGELQLDHAIQEIEKSSLRVLAAGTPPPDPLELLVSKNAGRLFRQLRSDFERIIVDTPPALPFTDADSLGSLADGFLLVVRERVTPTGVLGQIAQCITSGPILGLVMNAVSPKAWDGASGYDGYYSQYYERKPGK